MRKTHINIRNYDQPLTLFTYENIYIDGVQTQDLRVIAKNIKGNAMNKNTFNISQNSRAEDSAVSLLIQNPPFRIDINTNKVLLNNQIFIIKDINYNWITKGDIQLNLKYEKENDIDDPRL